MPTLWERLAALKFKQFKWTFDVVDPLLIPLEYQTVDPMKVHLAIQKGVRDIPGIKIYELEKPTTT